MTQTEMGKVKYTIVCLTIAALTAAASGVALCQQPAPSISLSGTDPLTVTDGKEARIDILNNTAGTLDPVKAFLVGTEQTKDKYLPDVLEMVSPAQFKLDPASALTLTVKAKEGAPEGEYTGYLVVYHANSNGAARRKVRLVIEKKQSTDTVAKPQPLVTNWKIKVYRGAFWQEGSQAYLPVVHVETGTTEKPEVIGYLTGSYGNVAEVRSTGIRKTLTDEADKLELKFEGAVGPDTFTGKVDTLKTSDEKDDVQVTLLVAHHFIYPVIALVVGLILALWFQQRYIGVLRPVWELRQKEAGFGRLYGSARATFTRESKGESYAEYTIEADVERRRKELVKQLEALSQTSVGKLDESNTAYKKIADELKKLEAVFLEFGSFAAKLRVLKEAEARARAALASAPKPGFLPQVTEPRILTYAGSLLRGVPLTVSGFETRVAEVAAATAATGAWPVLNDAVAGLRDLLATVNPAAIHDDYKSYLDEARSNLNSVWYDLWQAGDFKVDEVKTRLSQLHKSISLLIARQQPLPEAEAAESISLARSFDLNIETIEVPVGVAADRRRERLFRRRLRNADMAFIAVSLLVAVNTGLTQLYYDKPFGTPRDYLNALLWGFAAQTALSAFTAGLQRLWNWGSTLGRA